MQNNVKLCRETAEEAIEKFSGAWGLYDAKAIISEGKETSIPEAVSDIFLAGVMTGAIEISEDGRRVVHNLSEPIKDISSIKYTRTPIKRHMMTDIAELPEQDQVMALAQRVAEFDEYTASEMGGRDQAITTAIATYISFS